MLGILLMAIATLLGEASVAANKLSTREHTIDYIDTGIIVVFAGIVSFLIAGIIYPASVLFDLGTLPTFLTRLSLEIPLTIFSGYALMKAERSTFAMLRSLTIPLLLIVDLMMHYPLSVTQISGALVITLALASTVSAKFSKAGMWWCIATAIGAVGTISLYKIDIDATRLHHNSVIAEQIVMLLAIFIALILAKLVLHKPLPTRVIFHERRTQLSLLASAFGGIIEAFSYKYVVGTALVLAAKRGIGIVLSLVTGRAVFHEDNLKARSMVAVAIIAGLILMATPQSFVIATQAFASTIMIK